MTITVTADEVREIVPSLTASDAAIELQIAIINEKVSACLEASYSDDMAKAIFIYTVAYFAEKGSRTTGTVKSRSWADGDSEGYGDLADSTQYLWDTILQLDSNGCVSAAFPSGKVFVVTGKSAKYHKRAR
jgi:hypothetical protein